MSTTSIIISNLRCLVQLASKNNNILRKHEEHSPSILYTPTHKRHGPTPKAHDCTSSRRQTTFFPALIWDEQSCVASFKTQMGQLPTAGLTKGQLARPVSRPASCVSMPGSNTCLLCDIVSAAKIRDPVSYGTWGRRRAPGSSLLVNYT